MSDIFAQLGAILFQAGAFAALLIITPALYGLVVSMRRWWLVFVAAALLLGLLARLTYAPELAEALSRLPGAMAPDLVSHSMVAACYVMLAVAVRLATLRLEWLGWKTRSIKDIHVIGYLAPTVAALAVMLPAS
ncbi:MAG: hypothetical protein KDJ18_10455 [Hyphomicrobiaceae bacterium]|nr:hypothetical protein [Hyphomicrobiaceae bacterium]